MEKAASFLSSLLGGGGGAGEEPAGEPAATVASILIYPIKFQWRGGGGEGREGQAGAAQEQAAGGRREGDPGQAAGRAFLLGQQRLGGPGEDGPEREAWRWRRRRGRGGRRLRLRRGSRRRVARVVLHLPLRGLQAGGQPERQRKGGPGAPLPPRAQRLLLRRLQPARRRYYRRQRQRQRHCHRGRLEAQDRPNREAGEGVRDDAQEDAAEHLPAHCPPQHHHLCHSSDFQIKVMQLWVRGETRCSDNGWVLDREMNLHKVYDTVPGLPRDMISRVKSIYVTDIDAGQKWRLFIQMLGYGRYSFDLNCQDQQAGVPSDEGCQGVWAPCLCLLPRLAAIVSLCILTFSLQPLYYMCMTLHMLVVEIREVAEEKWRRHGRKKWRNFLVITTLLLFMVGYMF